MEDDNRKRPRKPTSPFGVIAFHKDGSVSRSLSILPEHKEEQEFAVAQLFARKLTRHFAWTVSELSRLDERDHDAALIVAGKRIVLQITEIPQRWFELPPGSVDPGNSGAIGHSSPACPEVAPGIHGSIQINSIELNRSILRAIENKLAKHYSDEANSEVWLLVYTTSHCVIPRYSQDGKQIVDESLRRAREFLGTRSCRPFSQIWFMNTIEVLRPLRVWPDCEPDTP